MQILRYFRSAILRLDVFCDHIRFLMLKLLPNINAGEGCKIKRSAMIRATDGGTVTLGDDVHVGRVAEIIVKAGKLSIGDRTFIGQGSIIACHSSVSVGRNCLIAEYVTIRDQDHFIDNVSMPIAESGFRSSPIVIEDDVWIGAKATITRGVTIGKGAVVGANSVVTRDVESEIVVVGVPATLLRHRNN